MNYLAHLLLAGPEGEARLGAFLGDFIKGRDLSALAPVVAREVQVHRHIDTHVDAHPVVQQALELFHPERRRFAGIALDVFYDHVLARDFHLYAGEPLAHFTQGVYQLLTTSEQVMPPRARHVALRMSEHDWLGSYADFDNVDRALGGIARRLSHGGERLRACSRDLRSHYAQLASGFPILLADLRQFAERTRLTLDPAPSGAARARTLGQPG